MRLFKCQASNVCWPLNSDEAGNAVTAESDAEATDSSSKLVLELGSSHNTT